MLVVFTFANFLLWIQGVAWQDVIKAILLEGLLILLLLSILVFTTSEKIILSEQGITQVYDRSIFLFKLNKRFVMWQDIIKIRGEFGILHIGERITIYISHNKMKIWDIILERDRIIISDTIEDFKGLVGEVVQRAHNAQLDEGLKKFANIR